MPWRRTRSAPAAGNSRTGLTVREIVTMRTGSDFCKSLVPVTEVDGAARCPRTRWALSERPRRRRSTSCRHRGATSDAAEYGADQCDVHDPGRGATITTAARHGRSPRKRRTTHRCANSGRRRAAPTPNALAIQAGTGNPRLLVKPPRRGSGYRDRRCGCQARTCSGRARS